MLAREPRHPGALHYLIHDYDDPDHARLALPAARLYAKVAPQSSHALHMPAHIFLQLGLWDDAAASDQASFLASDAWVKRKGLPIGMRDYHSLSWLLYESLQQGRFQKARETLDLMRPAVEATGAAEVQGPPVRHARPLRGRDPLLPGARDREETSTPPASCSRSA